LPFSQRAQLASVPNKKAEDAAMASSAFVFDLRTIEIGLVAIATATAATTTAAVATTATAAPTTAVATTATATTTTATRAIFTRLGLVDGEGAAIVLLPVQGRDGGLRFAVAAHLNKAEALAPAGVPVADDFRRLHGAVLREQLLQIRTCRVIAQVPDIQLAAHGVSP
jgi:hypothetical protein